MKTLLDALVLALLALLASIAGLAASSALEAGAAEPVEEPSLLPDCENPVGAWRNERGNTLTIETVEAASGRLTGHYVSRSGTEGEPRPAIGWINDQPVQKGCRRWDPETECDNVRVLAFTVSWGPYGSVTSWTGFCEEVEDKPVLRTLWHLSRANSAYAWDHVHSGADVFTPVGPLLESEPPGKE